MKKNKILLIIIMSLCCIMMSGCWDKVEIDKRVFVVSIGIDAGEDIKLEKNIKSSELEFPLDENEIKKLKVTYSFPDLKKSKEGSAETESISVDSYSLPDAADKFATKSSRALYTGHTKILLLSSEIFEYKDTVKELIDHIGRDPSFSRNIQVIVCEGKAEDYIKFKPITEKNIESYITGLMDNSERNNVIPKVSLNKFLSSLSENGNVLIPKIKMYKDKNEVLLDGMAIIKDYAMVGQLSKEDISDVQILKGKLKAGKKVIIYKGHPIDYIINDSKRNIKFGRKDGKLIFNIDIDLEGKMNGHGLNMNLLSEKELGNIQNGFDKVIKNQCERFIQTSKDEYGADFIGLDEYIRKYHPKVWKEIKKDWDEQFKNSIIIVNIKSDIRRIGVIK